MQRRVNIEVIFIATFAVLCLIATNVSGGEGPDARKTLFGTLWSGFRWVLVTLIRGDKTTIKEELNNVEIQQPEPTPSSLPIITAEPEILTVQPLEELIESEPSPIPTPESSPESTPIITADVEAEDIGAGTLVIIPNYCIINERDAIDESLMHIQEDDIDEPVSADSHVEIPVPTPAVELAGPIDKERILGRVQKLNKKLEKRLKRVSKSVSMLNSNMNKIADQETEVEIYLAKTEDHLNRENYILRKFDAYLDGISIAKGPSGMWESVWKNSKSEFVFKLRNPKEECSVSKISFEYVPDKKCILKKFYVKISKEGQQDVITNTWELHRKQDRGQNYSLPNPVAFDQLTIIVTDNYEDEKTVCLPLFHLYQPVGFLSTHM